MSTLLLPGGTSSRGGGLVLPGEAENIASRVRQGDPLVGWRGDPTMDVYYWESHRRVEVVALDGHGNQYVAATVSTARPGWQHDLLRRLRDGDWQNDEPVITRITDANARRQAAAAAERREQRLEMADRLHFAILRRNGAHLGGLTRRVY